MNDYERYEICISEASSQEQILADLEPFYHEMTRIRNAVYSNTEGSMTRFHGSKRAAFCKDAESFRQALDDYLAGINEQRIRLAQIAAARRAQGMQHLALWNESLK